jgi:CheY-like chemotaxis protein
MNRKTHPVVLLVAEDDEDDFLLIRRAMQEARLSNEIKWVKDGEELMDYLYARGEYGADGKAPCPGMILLDLNMPRKDGREALLEIKADPELRGIPVIVFTTSGAEEDVIRSYGLGVNSFIQKPVRYDVFVEVVKTFGKYWFEIVTLSPPKEGPCGVG